MTNLEQDTVNQLRTAQDKLCEVVQELNKLIESRALNAEQCIKARGKISYIGKVLEKMEKVSRILI